MKKILLPTLLLLAAGSEAAEKLMYAGANWSGVNVESFEPRENIDRSHHVSALEGLFGYQFHEYMKVEGRLGVGIETQSEIHYAPIEVGLPQEDTPIEGQSTQVTTGDAFDSEVGINYYASLYFRPEISNDQATLYGLIGVTHMNIAVTRYDGGFAQTTISEVQTNGQSDVLSRTLATTELVESFDDDLDDTGLSIGIGVGFYLNETTAVNVEWKNFIQGTDDDSFRSNGITVGFDIKF